MTQPPTRKPPKAWLAVLLSLVGAGLGHVYSGRVARALGVFLGVELLLLATSVFFAVGPVGVSSLIGVALVALAVTLAICADAARCAREGRRRFFGRGARVGACLAYVLLAGAAGLVLEGLRWRYVGESFYLPSGGMAPNLLVGDHLFSNPLAYVTGEPRRGDIVVFTAARDGARIVPADQHPELPRERFVKRIVGLPGDSVEFEGHVLWLDGERRTGRVARGRFTDSRGIPAGIVTERVDGREYGVLDDPSRSVGSIGPVVVEADRYFVAGDNRDNSNDSRFWGTVHRDHIHGPTAAIYWSWDFRGTYAELLDPVVWHRLLTTRTRWDRIGRDTNRRGEGDDLALRAIHPAPGGEATRKAAKAAKPPRASEAAP